jgi:hypothetical protein
MRKFAGVCTALAVAGFACASVTEGATASSAGLASAATVRVVRCRTQFGIPPSKITVPSRVVVRGSPRSTAGLAAYTNTELFLIGPAHMACSGAVGADGGTDVVVWPRGQRTPRQHSHSDGLTVSLIPACVGCMAATACPFFPSFASRLGFPCPGGVPAGEIVDRPSSHVAGFQDPPGVAGDGWPSGGRDTANGLVGIKGRGGVVYSATCTLPTRRHGVCRVSLNDVRARYG